MTETCLKSRPVGKGLAGRCMVVVVHEVSGLPCIEGNVT